MKSIIGIILVFGVFFFVLFVVAPFLAKILPTNKNGDINQIVFFIFGVLMLFLSVVAMVVVGEIFDLNLPTY